LKEADIQELFKSHAAEFTKEDSTGDSA
jgi:hypothetical protein